MADNPDDDGVVLIPRDSRGNRILKKKKKKRNSSDSDSSEFKFDMIEEIDEFLEETIRMYSHAVDPFNAEVIREPPSQHTEYEEKRINTIIADLQTAYAREGVTMTHDITVRLESEAEKDKTYDIPVNKQIITSNSPFLEAACRTHWLKEENVVELRGCDALSTAEILYWMHTGEIEFMEILRLPTKLGDPLDEEVLLQYKALFIHADYLLLPDLKEKIVRGWYEKIKPHHTRLRPYVDFISTVFAHATKEERQRGGYAKIMNDFKKRVPRLPPPEAKEFFLALLLFLMVLAASEWGERKGVSLSIAKYIPEGW